MSFIEILRQKIGEPYADFCLSPTGAWLGGTLTEVRDDGIAIAFVVRPEMCNPFGVLHGGIAATMMDEVIGASLACCGNYDTWFSSVNLHTDFLNSSKQGDTVEASAYIIRKGKNIANVEGRLVRLSDQKLLAKATSNLANTFKPIMV